ncbi:flagellar motor stator protein MotA [Paracidovorax anthurii]|uniref:Chemotaxis protein MotA n=1 Tax=Paracidovorax anthurii TaxID=78229 RepID=A0A328YX84_9BURK|nr:flagellar motor stator protein MotA [Paracidovorax anthurii]RAR76842.1 chemotaxis protein MotA [Paracidovorax anthurii]
MQSIIVIVLGCVFGGFLFMGGTFSVIWQPIEMLIILGSGAGALVVGNPRHVLLEMKHQVVKVVTGSKRESEFQRQLLLLMYELLQTAAGGLKALDAHVEAPHESELFKRYPLVLAEPKLLAFIVDNFRLMAMGKINAHELEGVLDQEIEAIHEEMVQPSKSLHKIAEGMPGFGIMAAVLGIVMTLNSVADGATSGEIATHVAAAMVGTFLGVFFCYGLLDPLSSMMKQVVQEELSTLESVKVVLVTHVAGKPPLLAIDAGRRLVQLNTKPSFAKLEGWIENLRNGADGAGGDGRVQQG